MTVLNRLILLRPVSSILLFILLISLCNPSAAQLCNGSLGDPVVNIDFGSGTSEFGKPLSTAVTSYTFVNDIGPSDGNYTIAKISSSGAGDSWHQTGDHTGNTNGYFMIVNASADPGDFYTETIHGLCGSTTYEIASWIINLNKPNSICGPSLIKPNVTFIITKLDGTVIKEIDTDDIAPTESPLWKQYGAYFVTQPNVHDVIIRVRNNASGGCGNDLALDDITFRPCGRLMSTYIEGGNGALQQNICQGTAATIKLKTLVSSGGDDPAYQWQSSSDDGFTWQDIAGATKADYTINITTTTPAGNWKYRLSIAEAGNIGSTSCRTTSNSIAVYVNPKPVVTVTGTTPLCTGERLLIQASGNSTFTVQWKGPANLTTSGTAVTIDSATEANSGKYYASVTSDKGCSITDSGFIATVNPIPQAGAGVAQNICDGTTTRLAGTGGGTYWWTPAGTLSNPTINNPVASPHTTTTYKLTVTNTYGCTDTDSVTITVKELATANAGTDLSVVYGKPVQLSGAYTGNDVTWYWTPEGLLTDAASLTPWAILEDDTTFILHVISACGNATDDVHVKVIKTVVIPNAFSPNGDGIHDTWVIQFIERFPGAEVSVFSRYGMRVFNSKGYAQAWNGTWNNKKVPAGTYYYLIDLKDGSARLSGTLLIL